MTLISNEVAKDFTFRSHGVTFLVKNIPTHQLTGDNGEIIETFSMPIASRLDQLLDDVLAKDPTPRTVELEF
ncbi:MAG: hypothetical protein RLZZ156_2561 [Deinococcota bacterium]|jgi:hypothetical protein